MATAYTLDRDDRILEVGGDWDGFARANGADGACAAHVLGGRLGDAIADDPTRMFMTAILMRVRASGLPETVPYRCDSPTVRRRYEMTLTPMEGGRVRVEHRALSESREPIAVRIRPARAGEPAVLRCSVCCRLMEGGVWRDPFEGSAPRAVRVVHTVCPDCRAAPLAAVRARAARPRKA